jgi:pimeloyl-ACP methyl ester carboxylesterase
VLFGDPKSLVGIVTDPQAKPNGLGFLFLNAGATHRVGPQRMSVRFARQLAERGFTCLRFDHAGIGDSRRRLDNLPFAESAIKDGRDAMDFLQATRGIEKFVVSGVCWGADNAMRVCAADPRVVGVAAIDFYAVSSVRHLFRVYPARLLAARSWSNILRGRSRILKQLRAFATAVAKSMVAGKSETDDVLPAMTPAAVVELMRELVARGVHLSFAFASSAVSYDQYVTKFRKPMRELSATGRLQVKVFDATDHLFTLRHNQARLWEYLEQWTRGVVAAHGVPGAA